MAIGTTETALLTGTVVIVGRWAEDEDLSMRVIVGSVFLAVGLTVVGMINDKLAQGFGILILVTALLRYALPIIKKAGFAK